MLTEFFEDLFLSDRKSLWDSEKAVSGGHVRLPTYGDSVVEKLEESISKGKMPDILEMLPEDKRGKFRDAIERLKNLPVSNVVEVKSGKEEYLDAIKSLGKGFKDTY